MNQKKKSVIEYVAYPLNNKKINCDKLPRLGQKAKRVIHSKNPYKIKQIPIKDDD